mgnify:CR=1 FL=1
MAAMNALIILLFVASALLTWSIGSHYTRVVMGTTYGAGVLSLRKAQVLDASAAIAGGVVASIHVIDTYANGLIPHPATVDIVAAQPAALVTTLSTYFKLSTSTIQIFTLSLLGSALVGGLAIDGGASDSSSSSWP